MLQLKSELTHVRGVANTLQKEIISLRKTEVQLEATLAQKSEHYLCYIHVHAQVDTHVRTHMYMYL